MEGDSDGPALQQKEQQDLKTKREELPLSVNP